MGKGQVKGKEKSRIISGGEVTQWVLGSMGVMGNGKIGLTTGGKDGVMGPVNIEHSEGRCDDHWGRWSTEH